MNKIEVNFKMSPTIPVTGRIGKLAKTIEEETSEEILHGLFQDFSNSFKGKEIAKWVLKMIDNLNSKVGLEKTIEILEKDGRKSCTQGFKNAVIKLMKKSNSIQQFVDNLKEHYKRTSFFELEDENTIIGGHRKCYLMIKSAPKPIDSNVFCYYCVGHGKEFYETALDRPVKAEIIESVMTGGDTCKFRFKF
jgi:hypothetical protein